MAEQNPEPSKNQNTTDSAWKSFGQLADEVGKLTSQLRTSLGTSTKKQDAWDKASVVAKLVTPLTTPFIIAVIGFWVNYTIQEREHQNQLALKERETHARLVELAIDTLQSSATGKDEEIRLWAKNVVDKYSGVNLPLPNEVLTKSLPSHRVEFWQRNPLDFTNAGLEKEKQEALAFYADNEPTEPLVLPDDFYASSFSKQYTFDIPGSRTNPMGIKDFRGTVRSAIGYPFPVVNLIRYAMLEAASSEAENVFDKWRNGIEPQLIAKLEKPPFPDTASPVVRSFLQDWLAEVMKAVEREETEAAKTTRFRLALKQAAYQITKVFVASHNSSDR